MMKKCHYREAATSMPVPGNLRIGLDEDKEKETDEDDMLLLVIQDTQSSWQPFRCSHIHINRYLYGIFMGNLLAGIHNTLTHTPTHTYVQHSLTNTALPSHSRCQAANSFQIAIEGSWKRCTRHLRIIITRGFGNRLSGIFIFFLLLFDWVVWVLRFGQIKFPVCAEPPVTGSAICFDNRQTACQLQGKVSHRYSCEDSTPNHPLKCVLFISHIFSVWFI